MIKAYRKCANTAAGYVSHVVSEGPWTAAVPYFSFRVKRMQRSGSPTRISSEEASQVCAVPRLMGEQLQRKDKTYIVAEPYSHDSTVMIRALALIAARGGVGPLR